MTKKKAPSSKTAGGKAAKAAPAAEVAQPATTPKAAAGAPVPRLPFRRPVTLNFAGVGRNDICPCGSGKRFKNCHGH
jgi:preprotein translocase subunit SecA